MADDPTSWGAKPADDSSSPAAWGAKPYSDDPALKPPMQFPDPRQYGPQFGTGVARGAASLVQDANLRAMQFANQPSSGGPENVGRFVGQTGPFVYNPLEGLALKAGLAPGLARGAWDFIGGAMQPTDSGTAVSHITGGAIGAGASAGLSKLADITAARRALPRNMADFNTEMYAHALEPIGGRAPTTAAGTSLADIRDQISAPLNAANARLTLDMNSPQTRAARQNIQNIEDATLRGLSQKSRSGQDWIDDIQDYVTGPMQSPQRLGGQFTGSQFADYVNGIRTRADDLMRAGRSQRDPDLTKRALGLRKIADEIEGASDGPADAKQARQAARAAYARWSLLNDASDPKAGGIFKASDLIGEYADRVGKAGFYDRMRPTSGHPDSAILRRMEAVRQAMEGGESDLSKAAHALGHAGLWYLGGPFHHWGARHALTGLAGRVMRPVGRTTFRPRPGVAGAIASKVVNPVISPFIDAQQD